MALEARGIQPALKPAPQNPRTPKPLGRKAQRTNPKASKANFFSLLRGLSVKGIRGLVARPDVLGSGPGAAGFKV